MKKILLFVIAALMVSKAGIAQDDDTKKKFRAGLKFSMQPCWFSSGDPNTTKLKTGFGYGFGLVTDFRLSDVIYFSTGIGGDFENATVKFRDDGFNPYTTSSNAFHTEYTLDNSNAFVEAKDGSDITNYYREGYSTYALSSRKIKTTYVTIPLSLKMLTKEFGGFRYFGQFGGDLGIRVGAKATDTYSYKFDYTATGGTITNGGSTPYYNIGRDCSLIPFRFGMNIGLGTEYRMAGSTSLFLSVNYFRSFTNLMRSDSRFNYTSATVDSNNKMTFTHLPQKLMMSAIKINIGVMF
jgi:hypothetical protein